MAADLQASETRVAELEGLLSSVKYSAEMERLGIVLPDRPKDTP